MERRLDCTYSVILLQHVSLVIFFVVARRWTPSAESMSQPTTIQSCVTVASFEQEVSTSPAYIVSTAEARIGVWLGRGGMGSVGSVHINQNDIPTAEA